MAEYATFVIHDDEMNHTWSSANGTLSFENSNIDETHTTPASPNRNEMSMVKGNSPVVLMDPPKEERSAKNDFDRSRGGAINTTFNKSSTSNNSEKASKKSNQEDGTSLPNSDSSKVEGAMNPGAGKGTLMSTIAEEPILMKDPSAFNKQFSPRSSNDSLTFKSSSSHKSPDSTTLNKGDKHNIKNKKMFRLFRRKKSSSSTTAPSSSSSYNSSNFNPDYINEFEETNSLQKEKKNNVVKPMLLRRHHRNSSFNKKNNDGNGKDSSKFVSTDKELSLPSQNITLLSEYSNSQGSFNRIEGGLSSRERNTNTNTKREFYFPNFSLTHGEDGFPKITNPSDSDTSNIFDHPKNNNKKISFNHTTSKKYNKGNHHRKINRKNQSQLIDPGIAKREVLMNELGGNRSNRKKSSNHKNFNPSVGNVTRRRLVRFSDSATVPEDHQSVAVSFIHADDSCVSSMTGTVDKINRQLRRRHEARCKHFLQNDNVLSNQAKMSDNEEQGNDRFLGKTIHIRHGNKTAITISSSYEDTYDETTESDDYISSFIIPSLPTSYTSEDDSQMLERVLEEDEESDIDDPHMLFIRQKAQTLQGVMDHPNYEESSSFSSSDISSQIVTEDWSDFSYASHEKTHGKSIFDIQRQVRAQHERVANDLLS